MKLMFGSPHTAPKKMRDTQSTQRCSIALRSAALTIAVAFPGQLPAQTVEDAAWSNAALALQYCLAGEAPGATRAAWFRQAGFAETVERSSTNSDTTHVFTAPADTVTVTLYYGEMPMDCSVESPFIGVTRAGLLLDALIPQVLPGFLRRTQTGEAGALCVSFEDPTNPIGLFVGLGSAQQGGCVEDGTVQFFSTYRV